MQKNWNYKNYVDKLLTFFINGSAGFITRTFQGLVIKREISNEESNYLWATLCNLADNGFVSMSTVHSPMPMVSLTETGKDYQNGGVIRVNKLVFPEDPTKTNFDDLWMYVGQEDAALFFIDDRNLYEALTTGQDFPPFEDFRATEEASTGVFNRRKWAKEIWNGTKTDDKASVLDAVSEKIRQTYVQNMSKSDRFTDTTPTKPPARVINNINAAVVNTGNGSVSTGNITATNFSQTVNTDSAERNELLDIISRISELSDRLNSPELNDSVEILQEEVQKPSWSKKLLRTAFRGVKAVAVEMAASNAADHLLPLVNQGLALL